MSSIACPTPCEFRQRAVELARTGDKPVAALAKDLGISESCLRNWMAQADADEGRSDRLSTAEKKELAELRRRNRQLEVENEILKRAAAYVGDRCQAPVASSRSRRPSKIFFRASWPLCSASSRWASRVGRNSMVVTKKVQDSQIDSKWQSSSTGRALGGFNRSSQHLERGGVDGSAGGMDEGVDGQVADEVAGSAGASARGRAAVLG
jgi:transposase-like protein